MSSAPSNAAPSSDTTELRQLYQVALHARDQLNQQLQGHIEQIRAQRIDLMRIEQKLEQAELARDAARIGRAKVEEETRDLKVQHALLQRKLQEAQLHRGQARQADSDATQSLHQENATLLGDIAGLRHEYEEIKRLRTEDAERYHQLDARHHQMEMDISVWQRQVEELHEALRQERIKTQTSNNPLQTKVRELEQTLIQTQAQREASQRMLLQREEDNRTQTGQHAQALRQAQQENEVVRRRYQEAERKLRTVEEQQSETSALQEQLKQTEQQLEQTRRARDASAAIRAQIQAKLEELQQEQASDFEHRESSEDIAARIHADYSTRLKEDETQLSALKQALDTQINRNTLLDSQLQALQQQQVAAPAVGNNAADRAKLGTLERALSQAQQAKTELTQQFEDIQQSNATEIARLREELSLAHTRAQQYQDQLTSTAQQAVMDVEQEMQELRDQLGQEQHRWQTQLEARTSQITALRQELTTVRSTAVSLSEVEKIKVELRDARDRVEDARAAQFAAERDLKRLQAATSGAVASTGSNPVAANTAPARQPVALGWLVGAAVAGLLTVGALEALALFSGRGELFTHLLSPSSTNTAPQIPPIEKTPEVTPVAALPTQGKPTTTPAASPKQREFRDKLKQGGNAPVLLELKGGTVELGSNLQLSPDEQPKYKTTLAPFALGKYEITQAEYALYAAAMNTPLASVDAGTRPVTAVTWQDAQGYATWLSAQTGKVYRLPSEAEWEYAVSGGQQINLYWWGMEPKTGMANCFNCGTDPGFAPMPVGQFTPNPLGLYDMTGNVREWVQDCYVNSYRNRALAKAANCAQRSVRGGGYDTPMNGLRSSKRDKAPPESQSDNLGFRIARDL